MIVFALFCVLFLSLVKVSHRFGGHLVAQHRMKAGELVVAVPRSLWLSSFTLLQDGDGFVNALCRNPRYHHHNSTELHKLVVAEWCDPRSSLLVALGVAAEHANPKSHWRTYLDRILPVKSPVVWDTKFQSQLPHPIRIRTYKLEVELKSVVNQGIDALKAHAPHLMRLRNITPQKLVNALLLVESRGFNVGSCEADLHWALVPVADFIGSNSSDDAHTLDVLMEGHSLAFRTADVVEPGESIWTRPERRGTAETLLWNGDVPHKQNGGTVKGTEVDQILVNVWVVGSTQPPVKAVITSSGTLSPCFRSMVEATVSALPDTHSNNKGTNWRNMALSLVNEMRSLAETRIAWVNALRETANLKNSRATPEDFALLALWQRISQILELFLTNIDSVETMDVASSTCHTYPDHREHDNAVTLERLQVLLDLDALQLLSPEH